MKYEDLIRKIFKNYKSKRELKNKLAWYENELEWYKNESEHYENELEWYKNQPPKIIKEKVNVIPIKCKRSINRYDINLLNEQEKKITYERIKHEIERSMFDYLVDSNIIKFESQFNIYEGTEELFGFMKVVK